MTETELVAYGLRAEYAGTLAEVGGYTTQHEKRGSAEPRTTKVDASHDLADEPVFQGATVALQDGKTFDIGEALAENDGVIVTRSGELIQRLDEQLALKRVDVPEGAREILAYETRTVAQLRELPQVDQIPNAAKLRKPDLIEAIEAVDAGTYEPPPGDDTPDPDAGDGAGE